MNKKGFTLVELLAVILIIGILIAVAYSVVNNQVKKSHYKAVKINADVYVKEVNNKASVSRMENTKISEGVFTINGLQALGVQVQGTNPDSGFLIIQNYKVLNGCLKYNKYKVNIINGVTQETEKGACKIDDSIAISKEIAYSSSKENDVFEIPVSGSYKIEVWGASGGGASATYHADGGYGGYTTATYNFSKGTKLYLYPGGAGADAPAVGDVTRTGGYNGGGGSRGVSNTAFGTGGGASHVALVPGLLKDISLGNVLVVAGGGGGGGAFSYYNNYGGNGGGCQGSTGDGGSSGYGGTQTSGGAGRGSGNGSGSFGLGGTPTYGSGGGGGLYGGGTGYDSGSAGGGGSGYINKTVSSYIRGTMYGTDFYSDATCENQEFIGYSSTPKSGYANQGNGYIKISLEL